MTFLARKVYGHHDDYKIVYHDHIIKKMIFWPKYFLIPKPSLKFTNITNMKFRKILAATVGTPHSG